MAGGGESVAGDSGQWALAGFIPGFDLVGALSFREPPDMAFLEHRALAGGLLGGCAHA